MKDTKQYGMPEICLAQVGVPTAARESSAAWWPGKGSFKNSQRSRHLIDYKGAVFKRAQNELLTKSDRTRAKCRFWPNEAAFWPTEPAMGFFATDLWMI